MIRKACVIAALGFLLVFAVSSTIIKAASNVELTPTSGEPGDTVSFECTDFAVSTSLGVGFGPEVDVIDESPTVTDNGVGSTPRIITGYTAKQPIKPGSLSWTIDFEGVFIQYSDEGDGTLFSISGQGFTGTINYTTGYFTQNSTLIDFNDDDHDMDYTTYEFDVTPAGLATNSSGGLSGQFTVPDIWNGTHTVTFIDSAGNVATSMFEVYGSDIVPEPLTIGAIVLLSSASLVVSFYWLRKKTYTKDAAS